MIRLQTILAPTDFSEFSTHSLQYACEFAKRFGSQLHLLHVIDEARTLPDPLLGAPVADAEIRDLQHGAESALLELPAAGWRDGIDVAARVVHIGSPFVEIVRYARQHAIDLIVMGTHGRSGLVHVLIGSTAERVIRESPCPVLTVRPEGHDFIMP
jgi:nucleotide-binding universal stress UspA family protein